MCRLRSAVDVEKSNAREAEELLNQLPRRCGRWLIAFAHMDIDVCL
jgi:hypothetical protein